jgi:hypothetical protein
MTPPTPTRRWFVRAAGLAAVVLFVALIARYWHPVYGFTSLIQLDGASDEFKTTAFHELPVYVHRNNGGYDGLYYAQIAQDPTLRQPDLPKAMDNFPYRARRILPPALAWMLGAGRPGWIIHTYPLLNLLAWFALAAILWRLLDVQDARGWLAWFGVLFSAGALASVRLALTDLVALSIIAGALLAAERARPKTATGLLAAAALARETSLLAFAGLLERPWLSIRNALRAFLVVLPLALWLCYIRWRVGPADAGWANFTIPGSGLVEKWGAALAALVTVADQTLAWTTLLATLGLTLQALFFVTRWRVADRWWRIGVAYCVLLLFLGTAVWEDFPGAAMRVLLPLTLAFNVLAHRLRAPLLWLILGNLTVPAGFVALRDVPADSRELASLSSFNRSGTACIARVGEGWFGREESRSHHWSWCSGRGTLTLEAWPRATAPVQLDFSLRAMTPRTVIVRQDGREVWRGSVGQTLSHHTVPLQIERGRATIELVSDTPGVRESPNADARELAFALYDLRLTLPKS